MADAEIFQFPARTSVTVSATPSEQMQSVSATENVSKGISVRSEQTLTVDQLHPCYLKPLHTCLGISSSRRGRDHAE